MIYIRGIDIVQKGIDYCETKIFRLSSFYYAAATGQSRKFFK
jgi:hypothetical protein